MQENGTQIAMAVDEFGGIAGLVTLKQLMEEIVGPVGEEGRIPVSEYEAIDENTFYVDGGMQIDEANDELGLELPQGEYETVAGFILDTIGSIPTIGEYFWYKDLRINVSEMTGVKIEKVIIAKSKLRSLQ
jgi:putative hemolysin